MAFHYFPNAGLPALSWLATLDVASGQCQVDHGRLVEARNEFFVEGVWDGAFDAGGFDRCESFFGSGIRRRPSGEYVVVPSSTTIDYVYWQMRDGAFVCSNSLPFLLAAIDDELDVFRPDYNRINYSILRGIERYEQRIPTRAGEAHRLMHNNLVVGNGTAACEAKPLPPTFASFDQYRAYLAKNLGGAIRNARDPARTTPLRVLSTQSKGYDSTAVNAIARDYGVDLALTIDEAKERQDYFKRRKETRPSDSGEEICRSLGMAVRRIDRRYFQNDQDSESLYWASVHDNQDLNLHQVKEHVGQGAILLGGALGELWYNAASTPEPRLRHINDELEKWDLSSHGLSEARLHFGYIQVPAPYIGARSRQCLFDLANSEAMRPWSIGGTYDRPIPRRIAEEAGVPREAFGQVKLASVVAAMPPYLPHGAALRREFFRFFRRERGVAGLGYLLLAPKVNALLLKYFRSKIRRLVRERWGTLAFIDRITTVPRLGERLKAVLYAYCVNRTAGSYRALRRSVASLGRDGKRTCATKQDHANTGAAGVN